MQTITQQRVSRALGFFLSALIVIPTQLVGTPASAAVDGAPGLIPSVRYDGHGAKSVSLSWDAPRTSGTSAVTDYVIEHRGAGGSWTVFDDGVSTTRTTTVTGLDAGRDYEFRVAATNAAGVGPSSVLGIGERLIAGSQGTCAVDPRNKYTCFSGPNPFSPSIWVEDPNDNVLGTRVSDITAIAGANTGRNQDLSCRLSRSEGVVCTTHFNEQGQQGLGYAGAPAGTFVVHGLPDDIVDISLIANTACALTGDGELWCWGEWSRDRFGNQLLTPTLQFRGVKAVEAGCAIQWDNTVTCLARDLTTYRWVNNPAFPTATALSSDELFNVCAITTDRTVACTSKLNVSFTVISGLTDVVEFDNHRLHWCALHSDGTITCNGNNEKGELGDGSFRSGRTKARLPEPIAHLGNTDEAGGVVRGSCAIGVSATVYCWGELIQGPGFSTVPKVMAGFGPWTAQSAAAPAQVTGLTQTGRTARTATVSWTAPNPGDFPITSYSINWRTGAAEWVTATVPVGTTTWTTPEVPVQSAVDIRVSAVSSAGMGSTSEKFTAMTADPPLRPNAPVVNSTTSNSVTVSWRPVSSPFQPLLDYRIDWSTDRITWQSRTLAAGETTATITGLAAGSAVNIRVSATNESGRSPFSETVTAFTTGLVSHSIAVRDAQGQPVYGGQVTWRKRDGSFQSALDYGLTVDGQATFPYIPAGPVDVTLRDVQLLGGAIANYQATTLIGFTTASTITLPTEPSESQHVVSVVLANGLPIVGATVTVSNLEQSAYVDGAQFMTPEVVSEGVTNEYGEVYVSGYSSDDTMVSVEYNDGILIQRASGPLGDRDAEFVLEEMPWLETPVVTTEPAAGSLVTLTLKANGAASATQRSGRAAVGATVSIAAPAGAKKRCRGAQLSSTVDANGVATLKVCATKSGRYVIRGKGVISTGAVALNVRGSAPLAVANARAVSPSHGNVTVSWQAPRFNGGKPISKYTVTLKKGKKSLTKVVTGTSAQFTNLPGTSKWTVTVTATSRSGKSEPVRMVVPVS